MSHYSVPLCPTTRRWVGSSTPTLWITIGLKGVADLYSGSAFLGVMLDPKNDSYFAGLDVGVTLLTGRAGITLGNNFEAGVYGELLGAGAKLGISFKNGTLEFKGGVAFLFGGGFYIRIKFW